MPTKVNIPNVGVVNFPDTMSEAEISDSVRQLLDKQRYQQYAQTSKVSLAPEENRFTSALSDTGIAKGILENLPIVGGAVGGLVGNIPGAIVGGTAGSVVQQAIKAKATNEPVPSTILGAAGEAAFQGSLQGALEGAGKLLTPAAQGVERGVKYLAKALAPRASRLGFRISAQTAIPDINAAAEKLGLPIKDLDGLLSTIDSAKKSVWTEYQSLVGKSAKETIDGNRIADAMVDSLSHLTKTESPTAVKAVSELADTYRRPITLEEAETLRKDVAAELDSYYNRLPRGQYVSLQNPDTAVRVAQGKALRQEIEDLLQQQSGQSGNAIRQRYGALLELEDAAARKANVAMRQQPGILEGMGRIYGASRMIRGAVFGEPQIVAEGAMEFGLGRLAGQQRNINTLVGKAFSQPGAVRAGVGMNIANLLRLLQMSAGSLTSTIGEQLASKGDVLQ